MTRTTVADAAAATGLEAGAIARLATTGQISWAIDDRRMMRVDVAELRALQQRWAAEEAIDRNELERPSPSQSWAPTPCALCGSPIERGGDAHVAGRHVVHIDCATDRIIRG